MGLEEELTVRVLLESIELETVEDGVNLSGFTGGREELGSAMASLLLPGCILAIEEEDGVEVDILQ